MQHDLRKTCIVCGSRRIVDGVGDLCGICTRLRYFLAPVGDWVRDAACAQVDPEVWFPSTHATNDQNKAIAICRECPVVEPCRDYAFEADEAWGIWGGTTERERRNHAG